MFGKDPSVFFMVLVEVGEYVREILKNIKVNSFRPMSLS